MSTRTWLLTALLAASLAALTWARATTDLPLLALEHPVETAVRVQERNLILAEHRGPRWRKLRNLVAGGGPDERAEAVAAFRDAVRALDRKPPPAAPPRARGALLARIAIVLLEQGAAGEARVALARLEDAGEPLSAEVIRRAYLGPSPDDRAALGEARGLLAIPGAPSPSWTTSRLAARFLARAGDGDGAGASLASLRQAAARYGRRADGAAALFYGLVLLGALCLTASAISGRWFPPLAEGQPRAPWTLEQGWSVAMRGTAAVLLVAIVGLPVLQAALGIQSLPLSSLLAALPLLVLLERRLLAPAQLSAGEVFGLRPRATAPAVAVAALGLAALWLGLESLIILGAQAAGLVLPWSDTVHEDVILGGAPVVVSVLLDGIVVAPVVEEIAFRGLVYGSLRARFAPWPAALLSAALFASLHLHQPIGMAVVFTGAVASALVYERTRSLWPCIAAHALNNVFALAIEPLLYR
jgi:membrane protease YdiL (CAAX protease family)